MGATLTRQTAVPDNGQRPAPVRTQPAPLRLTRRGRIVVTTAVLVLIGALSIALAGAAQATRHGRSGPAATSGGGRYLAKVTVAPGQTLWSIAEADDPRADTRLVIQDILQMNSLSGDQVQPGQVLWVPRG